jgi:hypothetical protein
MVAFARQAVVLPLVAVRQDGRPAGVAEPSSARIVLSQWELGMLNEVETVELSPRTTADDRRRIRLYRNRFPSATDSRKRGLARVAHTREVGADLRVRAEERGWDVIVVDGGARLLDALAAGIGPNGPGLLQSSQPFSISPGETADRVGALRDQRRADEKRLVDQLNASAAATRGVAVVERALAKRRLDHCCSNSPGSAQAWRTQGRSSGADWRRGHGSRCSTKLPSRSGRTAWQLFSAGREKSLTVAMLRATRPAVLPKSSYGHGRET